MKINQLGRIRGSTHEYSKLSGLPSDDCEILLVSSRTLAILADLTLDVGFYSRYVYESLDGGLVKVLEKEDPEGALVDDIVNAMGLEIIPMTCDIVAVLQEIVGKLDLLASSSVACSPCGSQLEEEPIETLPEIPGDDFADYDEYASYKCRAANWVIDGIQEVVGSLSVYDADTYLAWGLAIVIDLLATLIAASIFGGPVGLVAGIIVSLAVLLVTEGSLSLSDISSVTTSAREDLVCSLYAANNATQARADLFSVYEANGLTSVEITFLDTLLTDDVFNKLFFEDSVVAVYEATTSCVGCVSECPLQFQYGSGTFRYDGVSFTLAAEFVDPYYLLNFGTNCDPETSVCNKNWCMEFISHTITLGGGWNRIVYARTGTGCNLVEKDYAGQFPPLDTPAKLAVVNLTWDAPFEVTMRLIPPVNGYVTSGLPFDAENLC